MATAANIAEGPPNGVTPGALAAHRAYRARCKDLAASAGILNATYGHLVEVAVECLAEGDHVGPGLHTFSQFLAWRVGISSGTARSVERVARRVDELPVLYAALRAGEISLDQAAVVAQYVPACYDASATEIAKVATVKQLKAVLPAYREPKKSSSGATHLMLTDLDDGTTRISGTLTADQAARVRKGLEAMREGLWRQRSADAQAAAAEPGEPENPVQTPSMADALAAMAETALQAGEAAHPGSERYLISYHLQATEDGRFLLVDEHGLVVEESERRRLLCDHLFECVVHDQNGTPLSVGRKTRHINRKLRRAVLHRHGGRCAVPGCDRSYGLEIHHIVHWEDGGPTDTSNLVALCGHHHRVHHEGLLAIEGNADLQPAISGALTFGPPHRPLDCSGHPTPVAPPTRSVDPVDHLRQELKGRTGIASPPPASTPAGERLDRRSFHLNPAHGPPHAHGPPAA